jgi:hypothetical protein
MTAFSGEREEKEIIFIFRNVLNFFLLRNAKMIDSESELLLFRLFFT